MVVKLKKPHTIRMGDGKNGACILTLPAGKTMIASKSGSGYEARIEIPAKSTTLQFAFTLPEDNCEVVVK